MTRAGLCNTKEKKKYWHVSTRAPLSTTERIQFRKKEKKNNEVKNKIVVLLVRTTPFALHSVRHNDRTGFYRTTKKNIKFFVFDAGEGISVGTCWMLVWSKR